MDNILLNTCFPCHLFYNALVEMGAAITCHRTNQGKEVTSISDMFSGLTLAYITGVPAGHTTG